MAKVSDLSAISLRAVIKNNTQDGAEIRTDAWSGYNGIDIMGYKHNVTNMSASRGKT